MIKLSGPLHLRCNNCGHMFRVDLQNYRFEGEGATSNRPMGMGIDYNFPIDIGCPNCECNIRIDVMASEYPIGSLEFGGADIDGAEYTRAPEVEIEYEPDETSNEYYSSSHWMSPNEMIERMSPRAFELFVGSVFVERGFPEVIITQRTRDGGFDFEVHDSNHGINTFIIGECKHFDLRRHVGVEIVRGLHDTQLSRNANKAIIVTSSYFTRDARELAQRYRIDLWDISFLLQEGRRLNLFKGRKAAGRLLQSTKK